MISRRHLLATTAATGTALTGLPALTPSATAAERPGAGLRVRSTTVEYAPHPLGLDTPRPRLSWVLDSDANDQVQSAYHIRVATSPDRLGDPDVWDSGRTAAHQSVLVLYDGPALRPSTRYHWSVRVWDGHGRPSPWSAPAWWETGLLGAERWRARWITAPAALTAPPALDGASWIWFPEGDPAAEAPAATRWFRGSVPAPGTVRRAQLVVAADDGFTAQVNGTEVAAREALGALKAWSHPVTVDITEFLRRGAATLAIAATNAERGPAGLLATLELTTEDGTTTHHHTDATWRTTDAEPPAGWADPDYDDSGWATAKELAPWGSGPWGRVFPLQSPAQLRRTFRLTKPVARARLHSTALGLYEAHLNGVRVGRDQLAPGWTDYRKRVAYQTYDVTDALRRGANALGVTLAPGWYAGNIAWFGQGRYGNHPALLAQLEVTYTDGSTERITTDQQWRAATGPLLTADLLMGEEYDARKETPGWTSPGFDDTGWQPAVTAADITAEVVAQTDAPTRVERELKPVEVTEPAPGVHLFDLGQNMVGSVRLTVSGPAGRKIRIRHAEVLAPDGTAYTANLRTARPVDTYTLKGGGPETYEPRFTFHGFRYVEVTGYPGKPPLDAVTGRVMHTDAPFTMSFHTDSAMLNQLHSNITWGLRGNFLSIPTDTPARDERLGWTGDINVFSSTAAYTMESARFLTKWLQDLRDGQTDEGSFPDVAPHLGDVGNGAAGWGDAGVTVPWNLYQAYGDTRVLRENWPAMRRWITYLERHSTDLLRPAEGYGDWLSVEADTPKDVIATAYFAHATDLVARTAHVLGEDPAPYEDLLTRIKAAFNRAYVSADGRVKGDTQTAYVLALSMDLLPADLRKPAADRLVALVQDRDWHLSTGFLGTPRLLATLTGTGHTDVAYRLLHQRTFPSWGYQIDRGATTMWERWDSIKPDGSFQDVGMNSFNHYAYGSVGEWMYQNITGIAPAAPGFREILIRPRPGGEVRSAEGRYDSPHGPVTTRWSQGEDFSLTVSIPVNTTAEVWVPARRAADVTSRGTRFLRLADGCAVFAVGSGTHHFLTRGGPRG
ncbi:alpha-L-rhamnosidase [Streptomyces malaysiensis]|uniref:alpha-L-rhamnosidase n=1 Tax=Streptomyces autolyticus TaxID=75293 RepID=A0ABM6HM31_9ACTN|nr:alpha-L-rhamnosidase [Streptomyces autolyticus]AQA15189.1 rhamnosidase [Streptomyces autolyticus]